jgi:glutaminase
MTVVQAIRPPDDLGAYLRHLHAEISTITEGDVAGYIPELARVDPELFGISVATVDGRVFEVGDVDHEFTIQSVSKPMVYGLALEQHGQEAVLARIGVEPSGDAFNSITFDDHRNRPYNPMVNAGAIATTALVQGMNPSEKKRLVRETLNRYAGRELGIDQAALESERETGDRNRGIAYLMKSLGMLDEIVFDALDRYFEQCATLVTSRDLAFMAATLANDGVHPLTGEQVLADAYVRDVLSVMFTCGLYDASGRWAFDVGLPAKSGVGGGILAVVPGVAGIGVFSPRIDREGNSVRGVAVCQAMANDFGLHIFATGRQRSRFRVATDSE